MHRVLAIDGGGMRGLLPAYVLAELERLSGKRIADLFDVVAATSTGALIGLAMLRRGPNRRPQWRAAEIAAAYELDGGKFFERSRWRALWTFGGIAAAKYSAKPLMKQLDTWLGPGQLSQALRPVILTSYDVRARKPFVIRTSDIVAGALPDLPMTIAARCSSAGPTFYPPAVVTIGDVERWCADGALTANNPAMLGYADACAAGHRDDTVIVSLGAGSVASRYASRALRAGGAVGWLDLPGMQGRLITNVLIDGQTDVVHDQLSKLLPRDRYFRLDTDLPAECEPIYDASPANIDRLRAGARSMIDSNAEQLYAVSVLLQQQQGGNA